MREIRICSTVFYHKNANKEITYTVLLSVYSMNEGQIRVSCRLFITEFHSAIYDVVGGIFFLSFFV